MAARKKATTKRNTKKKAVPQPELNAKWSILFFGIGLLLLAMTFVPGESAWAWIRENMLFGIFGMCTYFVAPLIIYIAVLIARSCPVRRPLLKGILLLLLISGTVLAFTGASGLKELNFQDGMVWLHANGMQAARGEVFFAGGVISAVFGWSLLALCGAIGARIIMIIFTLLGVMYFTVTTPQDIYSYCATKVESARENISQYNIERKERVAARQREVFDYDKDTIDAGAFAGARQARRTGGRSGINIDLGPDVAISDEVHAQTDEPVIGPGGTFGMANGMHTGKEEVLEPYPVHGAAAPKTNAAPAARVSGSAVQQEDTLDTLVRKAAGAVPEITVDSNEQLTVVAGTGEGKQRYVYPPLSLFAKQPAMDEKNVQEELRYNAELLVKTLSSFGVQTKVLDISRGPTVTRYELQPLAGVKISRITGLADDIALNLAATGVRIEAPIPGKAAVGIEVPNKHGSSVNIRSILESREFAKATSPVPMALGKDIAGKNWVSDLIKMPHVLIAGSTGSGKSVCINAIIMSFLYKSSPEDLKLIMIDPKMVELMDYNGIPHLLMPVVTEPRKAAGALGSAVAEMEKRYRMFAENGVRNIEAYNQWAMNNDEEKMPYIAIVIDELADLMMVAGKEVEDYICRIAQKARAAGMHLIVATQRPSVDVITGLIKANIPSRIAFAVSSQIDSRTILDGAGAEKLLGKGDMLFMPVGASKPVRIQGTYVHDDEIKSALDFIKKNSSADYNETMIQDMEKCTVAEKGSSSAADENDSKDSMFDSAVEVVIDAGQASTSLLQRRLKLGYARAARIMDEMEQASLIGPYEGSKPRQVLVSRTQWLEMQMQASDDANPNVVYSN